MLKPPEEDSDSDEDKVNVSTIVKWLVKRWKFHGDTPNFLDRG
jgi:hypothetical protein